ncbi:MAG: hypothetical protein ACPGSB_04225 [Opitutales bacterium]
MPEFEENEVSSNSQENYTPSTDARSKPRTRRRSGGFKTEHAPPSTGIGEVDPADALKSEKLSGASKPAPQARKEGPAKAKTDKKAEPKAEKAPSPIGKAQPSTETLAAIQRVEDRIAERKKERDAKRAEREKNRPAKSDSRDRSDKLSGTKPSRGSSKPDKPQPSGGILASILSFFGLGPEEPAKKNGGKSRSSDNRSQGGGGPRGQRRKGTGKRGQGQNRRGGNGRRSGGGQRRNNNPSQSKNS